MKYRLSTKGMTWVTVVIILMLISVFGAFYLRYSLGQYVELEITRTLGVRLLLHGFSYAYNAMYSLPSGVTWFTADYPSNCVERCIDCNSSVGFLGITEYIECNCTDGLLGGGSTSANMAGLLSIEKDKTAMVCDDFFITNIELVSLSSTDEVKSLGIKAILQAYPKGASYASYGKLPVYVYTELPVDLIDSLGSRSTLYGGWAGEVLTLRSGRTNLLHYDSYEVGRRSMWYYDSIALNSEEAHGLKGIVDFIYSYCSSDTTPANGLYNTSILITPGNKLVKKSETELCEYKCFDLNSFEDPIGCNWVLDFCYDFNEITSHECANCKCNNITYIMSDLCGSTGVPPDINFNNQLNVVYGQSLFSTSSVFTGWTAPTFTSDPAVYVEVTDSDCISGKCLKISDGKTSGGDYDTDLNIFTPVLSNTTCLSEVDLYCKPSTQNRFSCNIGFHGNVYTIGYVQYSGSSWVALNWNGSTNVHATLPSTTTSNLNGVWHKIKFIYDCEKKQFKAGIDDAPLSPWYTSLDHSTNPNPGILNRINFWANGNAANYNFTVDEISVLNEGCAGYSRPRYSNFTRRDIFLGINVNNTPIQFTFTGANVNLSYDISGIGCTCPSQNIINGGCYQSDCHSMNDLCASVGITCPNDACKIATYGCGDVLCIPMDWVCPQDISAAAPLFEDCKVSAVCLANNSIMVSVSNSTDSRHCDSKGVSWLLDRDSLTEQKITISDRLTSDSNFMLDVVLIEPLLKQDFMANIINPLDYATRNPANGGLCAGTTLKLTPSDYPQSYEYYINSLDLLNETVFNLTLQISSNNYYLNLTKKSWSDFE